MAEQQQADDLHIFFFPILYPSHMMALSDLAVLFAERGVRVTIVTTHGNAFRFRGAIERCGGRHSINLLFLPFPSAEVGLPHGSEDSSYLVSTPSNIYKIDQAFTLLKRPFQQLLREHRPDCIVADITGNWCSDLGVPYLLFVPYSPFSICVYKAIAQHRTSSSSKQTTSVVIDKGILPHRMEMERAEIPGFFFDSPEYLEQWEEAERKSCGLVASSFYELMPEYVDHYNDVWLGGDRIKLWCAGPLFLHSNNSKDGTGTGESVNWERIKSGWLDLQPLGSVIYVCFGSEYGIFGHDQCREIALGLESSGHSFLWVIKEDAEWAPGDGFEERVGGRGVVWRGWAPQLQILSHPAVGGFVTHCGWNSIMEAVTFGVPMIAWPLRWEQFINERLIVEVLGIGIRVLEGEALRTVEVYEKRIVKGEELCCAIRKYSSGDKGSSMRQRAMELKNMARSAIQQGGSSYNNLSKLIEKLTIDAREKRNNPSSS